MKIFLRAFALIFLLIVVQAIAAFAQSPGITDFPDKIDWNAGAATLVASIKSWYYWAYAVVLFALPYLHRIPGISRFLNIIPSKAWQVAILGVLIGLLFVKVGGANAITIVLSLLTVLNPYAMFLKPLLGQSQELKE